MFTGRNSVAAAIMKKYGYKEGQGKQSVWVMLECDLSWFNSKEIVLLDSLSDIKSSVFLIKVRWH